MTETGFIISLITIGSAIWFGFQTVAWSFYLRRRSSYKTLRKLLIGMTLAAPAAVFLILVFVHLAGQPASLGEFVWLPVVTAFVFVLSWAGLLVAEHLKKS